jgi:predicted PurR-regulated permease PerM
LFFVRDIILLVFVSIIIVSAIDPIVDLLQKKKMPRALSVFIIYIISLSIIGAVISLLIPPIVTEVKGLGENLPILIEKFTGYFKVVSDFAAANNLQKNVSDLTSNFSVRLSQAGGDLFSGTVSFLGGIFNFLIVLSIAFYLTVQESGSKKFFASLLPKDHQEYALDLVARIQYKMGRWLQGQLLLMFIVFLIDYLGLLAIGAPYALVLALIAGLLEIIPYIGPIVSAVIATAISLLHGPITGLLVLLLFTLTQQLEGYVITPQVMKKAVGLNPVVVIVALLIGAKLAGVLGVIVSVPVATAIGEIINDLTSSKEAKLAEKSA